MRRAGAAAAVLLLVIAAAALLWLVPARAPSSLRPRPEADHPPLMLLTSLPLVFPEHFALNAPKSPVLEALQSRYRIVPISVADAAELHKGHLLLMAQPRAQPAEALVDLDTWVRGGGHVLLLADPALEWPSDRPLGSLLRPPFAFADTGLLAHWGLRLQAPDHLGPGAIKADGLTIATQSPGSLAATAAQCSVETGAFIAHCSIGQGEATVIADADFLNASPAAETASLDVLLIELARLEQ